MKNLNLLAIFLGIGLALASCSDNDDTMPAGPKENVYPISVTRTANYTTDTLRSAYTYNEDHQIIREDVFKNGNLEGYNLYQYNAAGKPDKILNYDATGLAIERSEITYNAANHPERLSHGYLDQTGQFQLHHYRDHIFFVSGAIARWTDYMPSGTVMVSRTYDHPAPTLILSRAYGTNNQLLNTSEITLDGKPQPFHNTKFNLITLGSNELRHAVKDTSGAVISEYATAIIFNAAGFPERLTQTHTDGVIKTETFVYEVK